MASATTTTTRTISNFANGKRAMSYQALNASNNTYQRYRNANKKGPQSRRDHSIELGYSKFVV